MYPLNARRTIELTGAALLPRPSEERAMFNDLLYDVLAVNMETHKVVLMGQSKTQRNAEAIENMAVLRRGLDTDFFVTVPAGKYSDGDEWDTDDEGI